MQYELERTRFVELLEKLVAVAAKLQNSPSSGLVPREALAADIIEGALAEYRARGLVESERVFAPGHEERPSLVLRVKGRSEEPIAIVGAHLDVVPADAVSEGWQREPFALWVGDGGVLYGRGTTDCLGHVALVTQLLRQLLDAGLRPERSLTVVFIANEEEASVPGVGLEYVSERGLLDPLKAGPIYWLDSADFGPTLGTGGLAAWELEVLGVGGHSGMTQNCVNALEVAMWACTRLSEWFRGEFGIHPDEARWGFDVTSTLKATMIEVPNRHVAKIPGIAHVRGDIRLTPFHDYDRAVSGAVAFIARMQAQIDAGDVAEAWPRLQTADGRRARMSLRPTGRRLEGIACDLNSPALDELAAAIREVRGEATPYSMTGSLPLVRDLQHRGFDVQITGFGLSRYYHAVDEQALLDDFADGFRVLWRLLKPDS